jgi:hypothetical protein
MTRYTTNRSLKNALNVILEELEATKDLEVLYKGRG